MNFNDLESENEIDFNFMQYMQQIKCCIFIENTDYYFNSKKKKLTDHIDKPIVIF